IVHVKHLRKYYPKATYTVLDLEKPMASEVALHQKKVTYYAGSITEVFETVEPVVEFHTAGVISQIAKRLNIDNEKIMSPSICKAKNFLDTATAVRWLVFRSSADVVNGHSWRESVNEAIAIPKVFDNPYAKRKVLLPLFLFVNLFGRV
ncbi:hypothetical protein V1509DRAFT_564278, partial [Lipomyces kononenkoae]